MISIRQKKRPTVGLIILSEGMVVERRRAAAICVNAPNEAARIRSIDNHTPAAPAAAARGLNVGQRLRSSARNRDLHQLAVGEEGQIRSIRRPKWIRRTRGSRQERGAR